MLDMSSLVLYGLAASHKKTMKEVERSMGGVIVDHQAKRILNRGRAEGRAEGELKAYRTLVSKKIITISDAAEADLQ